MHTDSRCVLVVGGAGFIGSHMVLSLHQLGYQVIVLDNLSRGHADAVLNASFVTGNMGDAALLNQLFDAHRFCAVMHFASWIEVGESCQFPLKYYQNNVAETLTLLRIMLQHDVKQLIFSSSASVYGEPQSRLITEQHPLAPLSPYGRSKMMIEQIIQDVAKSDGLRYAILRYFNAAGADPQGRLGERHQPESHLIPLILQAARDPQKSITIYGNDYPTADGTCIRDYVHVTDLCRAHALALHQLLKHQQSMIYNLGTGQGYSVQQVIQAAKRITGRPIAIIPGKRRPGDAAMLVADATLAHQALRWQPTYSDLETILKHAWHFIQKSN